MIKAILLDLGKVIVPFDFAIGYKALQPYCGIEPAMIRERIRSTGLVVKFETGLMEPREFVVKLCEAIGADVSYEHFCEIWSSIFSRQTLIPDSFLSELHQNYRLILVSNTNLIHFEMIRRSYPLLRHFDETILSYKVNAMKPSPVIFEAAIRSAECSAHECFFTDDIPEYVNGALACGIDAVLFEGFESLKKQLQARDIALRQ